MARTRLQGAASKAAVNALLKKEMNRIIEHNRKLLKLEKENKKLKAKVRAEEKALEKAAANARAIKARMYREESKKRAAALSPRVTRSKAKAKAGGCGCGCNGSKM
jgi:predicted RNase H-like nuclease (RuvC/YqgF family)